MHSPAVVVVVVEVVLVAVVVVIVVVVVVVTITREYGKSFILYTLKNSYMKFRSSNCICRLSYGPSHAKKKSSDICGQRLQRPACTSAQSDQGLCCPLTELFDTIECIKGVHMPGETWRMCEMNLDLGILHMFEDSILLSLNIFYLHSSIQHRYSQDMK